MTIKSEHFIKVGEFCVCKFKIFWAENPREWGIQQFPPPLQIIKTNVSLKKEKSEKRFYCKLHCAFLLFSSMAAQENSDIQGWRTGNTLMSVLRQLPQCRYLVSFLKTFHLFVSVPGIFLTFFFFFIRGGGGRVLKKNNLHTTYP